MSARDPLACPFTFHVCWNGIFDWRIYQSDRRRYAGRYLCGLSPRFLTEVGALRAASELRRVACDAWFVACGGMDAPVAVASDSEMVERVADVIWAHIDEADREDCLRAARGAIEAMFEPTEAMLDALSATDKMWREMNSRDVWTTMARGALK